MTRRRYLARRLALLVLVVFGISIVAFLLVHVLPGDPARSRLGVFATEELVQLKRAEMGLDKSLPEQYVSYMGNVFRGDLGDSWRTHNPVAEDFVERFPATIELALAALLIAVVLGVSLGVAAALRRNGPFDHLATLLGILGISAPVFWIGLLLIIAFVTQLHVLPAPLGRLSSDVAAPAQITGLYVIDSLLTANWEALRSSLLYLVLPAVTLGILPLAPITRMTRAAMIEALDSDFVRAARALGLSRMQVVLKIALRNALIPVVSMVGLQLGYLVGGAVLVEIVFTWSGIGLYLYRSVIGLDFAPIQSLVLIVGVLFALINLAVDMLYFAIDPRIRVR